MFLLKDMFSLNSEDNIVFIFSSFLIFFFLVFFFFLSHLVNLTPIIKLQLKDFYSFKR